MLLGQIETLEIVLYVPMFTNVPDNTSVVTGFESRDRALLGVALGAGLQAEPRCRFVARSFFRDIRACFACFAGPRPGALCTGNS